MWVVVEEEKDDGRRTTDDDDRSRPVDAHARERDDELLDFVHGVLRVEPQPEEVRVDTRSSVLARRDGVHVDSRCSKSGDASELGGWRAGGKLGNVDD